MQFTTNCIKFCLTVFTTIQLKLYSVSSESLLDTSDLDSLDSLAEAPTTSADKLESTLRDGLL